MRRGEDRSGEEGRKEEARRGEERRGGEGQGGGGSRRVVQSPGRGGSCPHDPEETLRGRPRPNRRAGISNPLPPAQVEEESGLALSSSQPAARPTCRLGG
eukprot:575578-Hanusia_phi.AAC.1